MSPMWQAGIAPTAAPSQLRLILLCQDRLAGLSLTAHERGSERNWTHQTLAALCLSTTVIPSDHVCFSYTFSADTLVFDLLSKMAVAMCCSLTLPSLTTVV